MRTYIPCGHYVLIKMDREHEFTKGGIALPEDVVAKEQGGKETGVIEAIGPNAWKGFDDGKSWAKVGDRVLMRRYAGVKANPGEKGDLFKVVIDSEILAIIREE